MLALADLLDQLEGHDWASAPLISYGCVDGQIVLLNLYFERNPQDKEIWVRVGFYGGYF